MSKLWKLWRNNHGNCCSFYMPAPPLISQSVTYSGLGSVSAVLYVVWSLPFIFVSECFRTGGSGAALAVCIIKGAVCILQSHYRRCLPFAVRYKAPGFKGTSLFFSGGWKKEEKSLPSNKVELNYCSSQNKKETNHSSLPEAMSTNFFIIRC